MSTKKQARAGKPMPVTSFEKIDLYQSLALRAFKVGMGSLDNWEILAGAMNFGGISVMRGFADRNKAVFEDGLRVIRGIKERFKLTGAWEIREDEIKRLQSALNECDRLMKTLPTKVVLNLLIELTSKAAKEDELKHAA